MGEEKKRFPVDFPVKETEFYVRWAKTERRINLVQFARSAFELFVRLPLPFRELVIRREWDLITSDYLAEAIELVEFPAVGTAEDAKATLTMDESPVLTSPAKGQSPPKTGRK